MLAPEVVHYGRAQEALAQRQRILEAAWAAHPERFVGGIPKERPDLFPKRSGSIHPKHQRQEELLSKSHDGVSHRR